MPMKPISVVLAAALLAVSPALPVFDLDHNGAAHAKGDNGGKGGGGKGGGSENAGGKGKSEAKAAKSAKAAAVSKKPKAAEGEVTLAKGKPAVEEGALRPNELGKMNGAMNANINAVLAHIRNGQMSNGPVGLLAGYAVATATAATAGTEAEELQTLAAGFDLLGTTLADVGITAEDTSLAAAAYLDAKNAGTLTEDQLAAAEEIDALIAAIGGTDDSGLLLAGTRPADADILAATEAAAEAATGVDDAAAAIGDAWNKDGDLEALLAQLDAKLAPYAEEISATMAEVAEVEETAEVVPEPEVLLPLTEPVIE